jgi:hypothetical protein
MRPYDCRIPVILDTLRPIYAHINQGKPLWFRLVVVFDSQADWIRPNNNVQMKDSAKSWRIWEGEVPTIETWPKWAVRSLAITSLTIIFAGSALAQSSTDRVPAVQALMKCREVSATSERLACYDAAAAEFDKGEAKGDIVVTDRAHIEGVRRQAFGFALPSLSLFERGPKPAAIDHVDVKVESAAKDGAGHWIVHLEGGQVWRQIDSDPLNREPKPGSMVTIHHGALDSYLLTVAGSNATIRVHRDL